MKKRVKILVTGLCLLGGAQIGMMGANHLAASQSVSYIDHLPTDKATLDKGTIAMDEDNISSPTPRGNVVAFTEPATLMLFGLGLLGLSLFRRKFK